MKILRLLMIAYANVYHLAVTALLGGIGFVAWQSGTVSVNLEMLPWTGEELVSWLLRISAVGFIAVALHVTGIFPYLLPVTSLALAVLMFRGFFWLPYHFADAEQFYWVCALFAGAVGAFLCSLAIFRKPRLR